MKMKQSLFLGIPLILLIFLASSALGATITVDCTGAGDYTTIMAGVAASSNGDTIMVSECTYVENVYFLGKAITLVSETGPAATIIDGNAYGPAVYFGSGEGVDSVVDGFTIRNGYAGNGGGIYCEDSSPTIRNNVITENIAGGTGGGIFCLRASPEIQNNTLSLNDAGYGGGIGCDAGSAPVIMDNTIDTNSAAAGGAISSVSDRIPTVEDNTITNNTATSGGAIYIDGSDTSITGNTIEANAADYGGGLDIYNASPSIIGNSITGNTAVNSGGGISCNPATTPTIMANTIEGNSAETGGGLNIYEANPSVVANTLSGNTATTGGGISDVNAESSIMRNWITSNTADMGGGIYCSSALTALTNNTIAANIAASNGGGIACATESPEITHNTITENSALNGGGIICVNASPAITNCIIWGNSATEYGPELLAAEVSDPLVSYSDVDGEWSGAGNFYLDPLFTAPNDYHLTMDSPCIDSGTDAGITKDIDGDTRPLLAGFDIGSDEYSGDCWDLDGDGFLDEQCGGEDCDDADPDVNPDEPEGPVINCDGIDNDCDGYIDEFCTLFTLEMDADYVGGTLSLDFTLGTPGSVTWSTFIIFHSPPYFIKLWSINLPALPTPLEMPIAFPFPNFGVIGIFTDFTTAAGIQAFDMDFADTSG